MENPQKTSEIRLVFQGSIPFEVPEHAEIWYAMLKEMVTTQSAKGTLNGQLMKMLEPCCSKKEVKP